MACFFMSSSDAAALLQKGLFMENDLDAPSPLEWVTAGKDIDLNGLKRGTLWNYGRWATDQSLDAHADNPPPQNGYPLAELPKHVLSFNERKRFVRRLWQGVVLAAIAAIGSVAYIYIAWIK